MPREKPSRSRVGLSLTVPPDWLKDMRESARETDLSLTSYIVCALAEAQRKGMASGLAIDGSRRHPEWVTRAARAKSQWTQIRRGVLRYGEYTLERKRARDEEGPLGWYLFGPGMPRRYLGNHRLEAEELALGAIHNFNNKE